MKNILLLLIMSLTVILSSCRVVSLDSPDADSRRLAVDKMDKKTATSTGKLMELLKNDSDNLVRAQCAYYLGFYKRKEALPLLLEATQDKDIVVVQDAVQALGKIGDPSAVPVLLKLLERDKNIEIRRRCAEALSKIGDPKAIEGLIRQLEDISPTVSYASFQALKAITKENFGRDISLWEKWYADTKETQP